MASSSLQGLNIIQSTPTDTRLDSDALLPDLAAQLDLWTHLAFEHDEPVVYDDKAREEKMKERGYDDLDDDDVPEGPAVLEAHDNAVTPSSGVAPASLDLNNFLAGFDLNSLLAQQDPVQGNVAPSLAQLLAAHSHTPPFQPSQTPYGVQPSSQLQEGVPPLKRARTRKSSTSTASGSTPAPDYNDEPNTTTPLSVSEDKRRRNTAASARFRLKKKEREAALEKKSKDLEIRVNELERECEGLKRENGWLKGLVVGVTGGAPTNKTTTSTASVVTKRSREETDAAT